MRRSIVASAVVALSACGGGSSSPTAPPPPPVANVIAEGQAEWVLCSPRAISSPFCILRGQVRNTGQGCASNLGGAVSFFNSQGAQAGSAAAMRYESVTLLRPNEVTTYLTAAVPMATVDTTATYRAEPAWTNTRCP